jgi:thioredoxin reductase (NADPH)
MMKKFYDFIAIGRGPAGIQAAIYTSRAKISTAVIGLDAGSLKMAADVENYYGIAGRVRGTSLQKVGERQAESFGAELINEAAVGVSYSEGGFFITTADSTYECRALLFATGAGRAKAPIGGLDALLGKGVSYCAACDGFFFSGKKVGVLGYSDYAAHEAMELLGITEKVTIYTNGRDCEFSPSSEDIIKSNDIKIVSKPVAGILGEEVLTGIRLADGSAEELDGLFIAYGIAPGSDLALKIGVAVDAHGDIVTEKNQETNVLGVFAAGDCTGGFRQVAKSVGEGAVAARSIIDYLKA